MNPRYPVIAERAAHCCEYCHAPEVVFNCPFEVEHVVPLSHGGDDDNDNCALACRACNLFKGDHVDGLDPDTHAATRLFHPRCDHWDEHFRIDANSFEVVGLTAVGKATVMRLRMNTPAQVAARRHWRRLGLGQQ